MKQLSKKRVINFINTFIFNRIGLSLILRSTHQGLLKIAKKSILQYNPDKDTYPNEFEIKTTTNGSK